MAAVKSRIHALYEDCGVSPEHPNAWQIIGLTLTSRHMPGFKVMRAAFDT
jgi:hypothetical protein